MSRTLPTVEDFNAIADEDTGLVPMRILLPTITDKVGDVLGYIPVTALQFYLVGTAEPFGGFKTAEAKRLHRERTEASGRTVVDAAEEDDQEIELAIDGFRDMHHLQLIQLAKAVSGKTGNMKKEDALAILDAEEKRRTEATAAKAQGAPGGTVTGVGGASGGVSTANLGLGVETGRNSGAQTGGTGPTGGQNGNTGTTTV